MDTFLNWRFSSNSGHEYVLRDWKSTDLSTYREWMTGHHQWKELDAPYYPNPTSDELETRIKGIGKWIRENHFPPHRLNLVIADAESDRLIGVVGRYWQSKETLWLSIGITIFDPTYWGRGIGYAALGRWCDYLWTEYPEIVRLDLRSWSGNHGMMRLAEKLGFVLEAQFRKARMVNGEWYDGVGYGILREEWQARYPDGFIENAKRN